MRSTNSGQRWRRWVKQGAFLLLMVSISSACHGQSSPADAKSIVQGTWVIKSIYPTPNVQGPDPSQQRKLVGSQVIVGAQSLHACGQSVPIKSVEIHQVSPDDFLANTRVRFSDVEIHSSSVTELVMNNREAGSCFQAFALPGQDIYIKSNDEILIAFEGVFYKAVKKK